MNEGVVFTSGRYAAAGKHSNCSAAVEPVASGRVDDGGGDDDRDVNWTTECPSMPGDGSRAIREPGLSNTWPTCSGDARRQRPPLRRDAIPLAIGTGELPGDDGHGAGDGYDDRERRPSIQRRSGRDSGYNRRPGNRPTTAMAACRGWCCKNCRRRLTRRRLFRRCCCC